MSALLVIKVIFAHLAYDSPLLQVKTRGEVQGLLCWGLYKDPNIFTGRLSGG